MQKARAKASEISISLFVLEQQIKKKEMDNIKAGADFICEMWDGMK